MTEWEEWSELLLVDPAITYIETFVIIYVPDMWNGIGALDARIAAWIGYHLLALLQDWSIDRTLVKRSIPGHWEVARRVLIAYEDSSE